ELLHQGSVAALKRGFDHHVVLRCVVRLYELIEDRAVLTAGPMPKRDRDGSCAGVGWEQRKAKEKRDETNERSYHRGRLRCVKGTPLYRHADPTSRSVKPLPDCSLPRLNCCEASWR